MPSITVKAHAKINLELRVTGVRPDGFHDLETVFQTIALHDLVTCEARPGPFALACDAPGVPSDERNLAWRAAAALWRRIGRPGQPWGAAIVVEKRIPAEAGLGGGSADAAAALCGLARVWESGAGPDVLAEAAAEVGSDVAFFLVGGTAVGRGRGERLVPAAELPPRGLVLLLPGFGVSTATAYRWYDEDRTERPPADPLGPGWTLPGGSIRNDLEAPVARRHPAIVRAKADLVAAGAETAGLSGSGSAVFGVFPTAEAAQTAAGRLAGRGWRALPTRTLSRAEHEARLDASGLPEPD